jgi:biotin carboxyl carrier protein
MKHEVEIDGRLRELDVNELDGVWKGKLDGKSFSADAREVDDGIYSILIGGLAYEVHVEPQTQGLRLSVGSREFVASVRDPRRWHRGSRGSASAMGSQEITAPMPGKVVRVLAKAGDVMAEGQGILVVEAMKMQNEIRVPKAGKLQRLLVEEGRTVNAGDLLAVVD